MTKKDYIALAKAISDARKSVAEGYNRGRTIDEEIILHMVHVFKRDNPKFDADKFREACK